ncbi:MAG TPA: 50S ribosomal protein L30 [Salinivirga sp.]|uniref:Large ribosomal subunit protein uL30 n=1 Tax=Salinivirga cyanobacteriivorans TaxID=1307839 RepID=A0A0S2I2M0_9BACT|nr:MULTISPECIES: 50S ribosomal protein L30 [Salinivirga]ALO16680.1 50S ribosomal protein L30 [Salinivirga cyanobacteriivorans]HKK58249.1 50S ribosomal protein L30 [Salinivirga sp.]
MAKIRITQTRSIIGSDKRQKKTVEALGLKRIRHTVEHEDNAVIRGMVKKVEHLVKVEEIN